MRNLKDREAFGLILSAQSEYKKKINPSGQELLLDLNDMLLVEHKTKPGTFILNSRIVPILLWANFKKIPIYIITQRHPTKSMLLIAGETGDFHTMMISYCLKRLREIGINIVKVITTYDPIEPNFYKDYLKQVEEHAYLIGKILDITIGVKRELNERLNDTELRLLKRQSPLYSQFYWEQNKKQQAMEMHYATQYNQDYAKANENKEEQLRFQCQESAKSFKIFIDHSKKTVEALNKHKQTESKRDFSARQNYVFLETISVIQFNATDKHCLDAAISLLGLNKFVEDYCNNSDEPLSIIETVILLVYLMQDVFSEKNQDAIIKLLNLFFGFFRKIIVNKEEFSEWEPIKYLIDQLKEMYLINAEVPEKIYAILAENKKFLLDYAVYQFKKEYDRIKKDNFIPFIVLKDEDLSKVLPGKKHLATHVKRLLNPEAYADNAPLNFGSDQTSIEEKHEGVNIHDPVLKILANNVFALLGIQPRKILEKLEEASDKKISINLVVNEWSEINVGESFLGTSNALPCFILTVEYEHIKNYEKNRELKILGAYVYVNKELNEEVWKRIIGVYYGKNLYTPKTDVIWYSVLVNGLEEGIKTYVSQSCEGLDVLSMVGNKLYEFLPESYRQIMLAEIQKQNGAENEKTIKLLMRYFSSVPLFQDYEVIYQGSFLGEKQRDERLSSQKLFLNKLTKMRKLRLNHCLALDDKCLVDLLKRNPELKLLDISSTKVNSVQTLNILSEICKGLEIFCSNGNSFSHFAKIDKKGSFFNSLSTDLIYPNLKELYLASSKIEEIKVDAPSLEILMVKNLGSLKLFSVKAKQLKQFACEEVGKQIVKHAEFLQKFPFLYGFSLENCSDAFIGKMEKILDGLAIKYKFVWTEKYQEAVWEVFKEILTIQKNKVAPALMNLMEDYFEVAKFAINACGYLDWIDNKIVRRLGVRLEFLPNEGVTYLALTKLGVLQVNTIVNLKLGLSNDDNQKMLAEALGLLSKKDENIRNLISEYANYKDTDFPFRQHLAIYAMQFGDSRSCFTEELIQFIDHADEDVRKVALRSLIGLWQNELLKILDVILGRCIKEKVFIILDDYVEFFKTILNRFGSSTLVKNHRLNHTLCEMLELNLPASDDNSMGQCNIRLRCDVLDLIKQLNHPPESNARIVARLLVMYENEKSSSVKLALINTILTKAAPLEVYRGREFDGKILNLDVEKMRQEIKNIIAHDTLENPAIIPPAIAHLDSLDDTTLKVWVDFSSDNSRPIPFFVRVCAVLELFFHKKINESYVYDFLITRGKQGFEREKLVDAFGNFIKKGSQEASELLLNIIKNKEIGVEVRCAVVDAIKEYGSANEQNTKLFFDIVRWNTVLSSHLMKLQIAVINTLEKWIQADPALIGNQLEVFKRLTWDSTVVELKIAATKILLHTKESVDEIIAVLFNFKDMRPQQIEQVLSFVNQLFNSGIIYEAQLEKAIIELQRQSAEQYGCKC